MFVSYSIFANTVLEAPMAYWDSVQEPPEGSRRAGLNSTFVLFVVIFCASVLCLIVSPNVLVTIKLLCCLPTAQLIATVVLFIRAQMQGQTKTVEGLWIGVLLSVGLDTLLGFGYFFVIAAMTDGFRWNLAR